jgi:hypothetical protein
MGNARIWRSPRQGSPLRCRPSAELTEDRLQSFFPRADVSMPRERRTFTMVLSAVLLAGCSDRMTAPSAESSLPRAAAPAADAVKFWEVGAAVGWNSIARGLTLAHQQSPIGGQRIFAYLTLALYNAVIAAGNGEGHPSPQAAVPGRTAGSCHFSDTRTVVPLQPCLRHRVDHGDPRPLLPQ